MILIAMNQYKEKHKNKEATEAERREAEKLAIKKMRKVEISRNKVLNSQK